MIFGDLERAVAQLYPSRVPIAIAILIGVVALLIVARRCGWFASLQRHPRAAVTGAVVVLVVALPIAWVLVSPLFIRTQVDEAPPVLVAAGSPAPGQTLPGPGEAAVVLAGSFSGADEFHFGSGEAVVVETVPGRYTLRLQDFSVRNGPDLFVYLSPGADGYADGAIELGALKATDGSFNYEIPPGTDLGTIRSAIIWCRAFSVLFAAAPLSAS